MKIITTCERYFTPIGRIILGAFFLIAGIEKLFNLSGIVGYIDATGLPAPAILAGIGILIEVGAGGSLLIGYKTKYAALILALFTLVVSLLFHGPSLWSENPTQQMLFMKNIAIAGGLLFMAAHIGSPCCGAHTAKNHDHTVPKPSL